MAEGNLILWCFLVSQPLLFATGEEEKGNYGKKRKEGGKREKEEEDGDEISTFRFLFGSFFGLSVF